MEVVRCKFGASRVLVACGDWVGISRVRSRVPGVEGAEIIIRVCVRARILSLLLLRVRVLGREVGVLVCEGAEIIIRVCVRVRILSLLLLRVRELGREVGVLVCEGVEAIGCA